MNRMQLRKPLSDFVYVYENEPPAIFDVPALLHIPVMVRLDSLFLPKLAVQSRCRLALVPFHTDSESYAERIRELFPKARIVTYSDHLSREIEEASARHHFSLHLYRPHSTSLLDALYRNLTAARPISRPSTHSPYLHQPENAASIRNLCLKEEHRQLSHDYARLVKQVLNCDFLFFFTENPETRQLELTFTDHDAAKTGDDVKDLFPRLSTLASDADNTPRLRQEPEEIQNQVNLARLSPVHSLVTFPFRIKRQAGLLIGINRRRPKSVEVADLALLKNLCALFLQIGKNVLSCEQARHLAIIDDLTSLFNFRFLRRYLHNEIRQCLVEEKNLSLLFIDIDNFKRVNDTYGHVAGSAVICEMGSIFQRVVRSDDVIARYGGDEFVIAFPGLVLDDAAVIGERLRSSVDKTIFRGQANLCIDLTISVGVASFPTHARTMESLLKKADAAMYAAKMAGKNKIMIAGQ